MVSITKYGDVMPCPYIHTSLGNFFEEPLKDIISRGLNIKHFGRFVDTCLIAEDIEFIESETGVGVGMIGVVHANKPIDALQRLLDAEGARIGEPPGRSCWARSRS